jgi:hypothetical protein
MVIMAHASGPGRDMMGGVFAEPMTQNTDQETEDPCERN